MSEKCPVCFRHCSLEKGQLGFCGVRSFDGEKIIATNYGIITSLGLDPIEKKPLAHFHPGSMILSVGSYGCNLRCPFCQNHEISWSEEAMRIRHMNLEVETPEKLSQTAAYYQDKGNIGLAFTYNEPLVGYEYVRDTAKLIHELSMVNVLVTNGCVSLEVLKEIEPYIDAMNIDLKGFTDEYYREVLGGNREMVMNFIEEAAKHCHVELTTLIVPNENDSEEEMREMCKWIANLESQDPIVLHISRFFPRFQMQDKHPTDVKWIYHLAEIAREELEYVYTGNC